MERDQDLVKEYRMEQSGYFDWLSDNISDLKAEYMTQYSVNDLIQHFFWDEATIEDFFNYHQDTFDDYCEESFDASRDWEATKNSLNKTQA